MVQRLAGFGRPREANVADRARARPAVGESDVADLIHGHTTILCSDFAHLGSELGQSLPRAAVDRSGEQDRAAAVSVQRFQTRKSCPEGARNSRGLAS